MKECALFVCHNINEKNIARFNKLKQLLICDVYWIYCNDGQMPNNTIDTIIQYTNKDLFEIGYKPIFNRIIPGSTYFAVLKFWLDHMLYDYYWYIEYDVAFTGNWSDLFYFYKDDVSDVISSGVELKSDVNSKWPWWSVKNNCGYKELVRSFNPIYRISNRALQILDKHLKEGYSAHYEVMLCTCAKNNGLIVRSFDKQHCEIRKTMRWRPLWQEKLLVLKNTLYHPIK